MELTREIADLVIDRMLDLWETSNNWTQLASARSKGGEEVSTTDEDAVKWCAAGCASRALWQMGMLSLEPEFANFMNYWTELVFAIRTVVHFNDNPRTSFEDMRLFVKDLKSKDIPDTRYHRFDPNDL